MLSHGKDSSWHTCTSSIRREQTERNINVGLCNVESLSYSHLYALVVAGFTLTLLRSDDLLLCDCAGWFNQTFNASLSKDLFFCCLMMFCCHCNLAWTTFCLAFSACSPFELFWPGFKKILQKKRNKIRKSLSVSLSKGIAKDQVERSLKNIFLCFISTAQLPWQNKKTEECVINTDTPILQCFFPPLLGLELGVILTMNSNYKLMDDNDDDMI